MARKKSSKKKSEPLQCLRLTMNALKDHKGNVIVPERTGGWHIVSGKHGRFWTLYCGCTLPMRRIDGVIHLSNFDTLDLDTDEFCMFCWKEYEKEKETK